MKLVKNTPFIIDAMATINSFIWIEDLYLLLIGKGYKISSRTLYKAVQYHTAIGLLRTEVKGRRTMVGLNIQ